MGVKYASVWTMSMFAIHLVAITVGQQLPSTSAKTSLSLRVNHDHLDRQHHQLPVPLGLTGSTNLITQLGETVNPRLRNNFVKWASA